MKPHICEVRGNDCGGAEKSRPVLVTRGWQEVKFLLLLLLTYFRRLAKAMAAKERTSLSLWCISFPAREANSLDVRFLFFKRPPPFKKN